MSAPEVLGEQVSTPFAGHDLPGVLREQLHGLSDPSDPRSLVARRLRRRATRGGGRALCAGGRGRGGRFSGAELRNHSAGILNL